MASVWQQEGYRGSSVRSLSQRLSLCPMEPPPAGSRMDVLAKAEPVRSKGNVSGTMDFKRGKSCCTAAIAAKTGVRMWESKIPQTSGPVRKEGQEVLQVSEPCSPWCRLW